MFPCSSIPYSLQLHIQDFSHCGQACLPTDSKFSQAHWNTCCCSSYSFILKEQRVVFFEHVEVSCTQYTVYRYHMDNASTWLHHQSSNVQCPSHFMTGEPGWRNYTVISTYLCYHWLWSDWTCSILCSVYMLSKLPYYRTRGASIHLDYYLAFNTYCNSEMAPCKLYVLPCQNYQTEELSYLRQGVPSQRT